MWLTFTCSWDHPSGVARFKSLRLYSLSANLTSLALCEVWGACSIWRRFRSNFGKDLSSVTSLTISAIKFHFSYYRKQTKLRKGNVFTSVSQEFCPRGGGGGCIPACIGEDTRQADTPGQTPLGRHPSLADGYCSGQYASYWNAFLCFLCFQGFTVHSGADPGFCQGLCIPACTGADTPRANTPWVDPLGQTPPRSDTPPGQTQGQLLGSQGGGGSFWGQKLPKWRSQLSVVRSRAHFRSPQAFGFLMLKYVFSHIPEILFL